MDLNEIAVCNEPKNEIDFMKPVLTFFEAFWNLTRTLWKNSNETSSLGISWDATSLYSVT